MTNRERTGWRDYAYSAWHRSLSDSLSFMDVDWIEWCKTCYKRLAIYELAVDNGKNDGKQCWVTRELAKSANLKGFLVLYSKDQDSRITSFRVRQLAPAEQTEFTIYTPDQWAERLYALRWCHPLTRQAQPLPAPIAARRPARECPACHRLHPVGTTCAWAESA